MICDCFFLPFLLLYANTSPRWCVDKSDLKCARNAEQIQRQDFSMILGSRVIIIFPHTKFQEFIKLLVHAGIAECYRFILITAQVALINNFLFSATAEKRNYSGMKEWARSWSSQPSSKHEPASQTAKENKTSIYQPHYLSAGMNTASVV